MKLSFTLPISGELLPITSTPDDVFSNKLLGDGFGIYPLDNQIHSPIYGTVQTIYRSEHIIIIEHASCHVMLHLGLKARNDIVSWNVKIGDLLLKGQVIGQLKPAFFKQPQADQMVNIVFLETKSCHYEAGNVICDEA
jgi:phosphotransferase system IIA component